VKTNKDFSFMMTKEPDSDEAKTFGVVTKIVLCVNGKGMVWASVEVQRRVLKARHRHHPPVPAVLLIKFHCVGIFFLPLLL
jgi:hypothetical protein